jgi:hypothetical protein
MTDASCHEPGNGGRPVCIQSDRLDAIESEAAQRTIAEARLERRVTEEFLGVFAAISRVETKVDRLLEGVEIGQVRAAQASRDWELDEDTHVTGASGWAQRARSEAERSERLTAQVAALQATVAERDRLSERVRVDARYQDGARNRRLQIVGGIVVAIVTSGVGSFLLAKLFGG